MATTALTRLQRLQNRRLDPMMRVGEANEAYKRLTTEDTAVRYAIGAMQPIDPAYTKNTIEERKRVEDQLANGYRSAGLGVSFDYQGSVTNDTHIRAHSDVDLLTVEERFYMIQSPPSVYDGDPVADLRQIRRNAASMQSKSREARFDARLMSLFRTGGIPSNMSGIGRDTGSAYIFWIMTRAPRLPTSRSFTIR
jgi:hypothetical protein